MGKIISTVLSLLILEHYVKTLDCDEMEARVKSGTYNPSVFQKLFRKGHQFLNDTVKA